MSLNVAITDAVESVGTSNAKLLSVNRNCLIMTVSNFWVQAGLLARKNGPKDMIAPPFRLGTAGSAWRFPQNGD
jgi:hypothetical protein